MVADSPWRATQPAMRWSNDSAVSPSMSPTTIGRRTTQLLVALCAEVETLAGRLDIDPAGFWQMMETTLADVAQHGSAAALTGPVARGDWATVRAHLNTLDDDQREPYIALARVAARVARRELPSDLT
jgi:predicted short-subunit dehydrogenase-like oxidoreductase (DUF2520 family)